MAIKENQIYVLVKCLQSFHINKKFNKYKTMVSEFSLYRHKLGPLAKEE